MRMRDAAKRRLLGAERTAWGWRQQGRSLKQERRCIWNDISAKNRPTDPRGCEAKPQITRTRTELPDQMFRSQQQTKELVT
jgi:hypothetical protein